MRDYVPDVARFVTDAFYIFFLILHFLGRDLPRRSNDGFLAQISRGPRNTEIPAPIITTNVSAANPNNSGGNAL
jgi:hypothetical protein